MRRIRQSRHLRQPGHRNMGSLAVFAGAGPRQVLRSLKHQQRPFRRPSRTRFPHQTSAAHTKAHGGDARTWNMAAQSPRRSPRPALRPARAPGLYPSFLHIARLALVPLTAPLRRTQHPQAVLKHLRGMIQLPLPPHARCPANTRRRLSLSSTSRSISAAPTPHRCTPLRRVRAPRFACTARMPGRNSSATH